jgi:hypothetical protein
MLQSPPRSFATGVLFMTIDEILSKLKGVKRSNDGFVAKCPAHDDRTGSLSVGAGRGKVLMHCFAGCTAPNVVKALGLEWRDMFDTKPHPASPPRIVSQDGVVYCGEPKQKSKVAAVYRYTDETGQLLYENVRFEPKDFRQRQVRADGTVDWSLTGVARVPYRLRVLAANAKDNKSDVWLCEGEKDADALAELGFVTSNFKQWTADFNKYIEKTNVVIVRDHDRPGVMLADEAARVVSKAADSVKVLDVHAEYELPEKHGLDISDYVARCVKDEGLTREEIAERLALMADGLPRWADVNPSRNLFFVKTGNRWLEAAKNRADARMLFGEFWFEGELCILFADTNVGKSILAVQIGDLISRGEVTGERPHELGTECGPKRVVYFDFELTDKQFEARLSVQDGGSGARTRHHQFSDNFLRAEIDPSVGDLNGFKTFEDFLNHSLDRTIVEQRADVLIIDNLTYLRDETENARNALPLMKYLKELKTRHNISILALAHTPKRDSSKPLGRNDLQGSKMIINFCDSSFAIGESQKEPNLRYLKQIKSRNTGIIYHSENVLLARIDRVGSLLQFVFDGTGSEYKHLKEKASDDKEVKKAENIEKVRERHAIGLTTRQIADEIGISHMTVSRYIKEL